MTHLRVDPLPPRLILVTSYPAVFKTGSDPQSAQAVWHAMPNNCIRFARTTMARSNITQDSILAPRPTLDSRSSASDDPRP
eukprot:8161-Rhodomonas_salina.1